MTHEEKALAVVDEWRRYWMNEPDYVHRRIDANMRHDLKRLFAAALREERESIIEQIAAMMDKDAEQLASSAKRLLNRPGGGWSSCESDEVSRMEGQAEIAREYAEEIRALKERG